MKIRLSLMQRFLLIPVIFIIIILSAGTLISLNKSQKNNERIYFEAVDPIYRLGFICSRLGIVQSSIFSHIAEIDSQVQDRIDKKIEQDLRHIQSVIENNAVDLQINDRILVISEQVKTVLEKSSLYRKDEASEHMRTVLMPLFSELEKEIDQSLNNYKSHSVLLNKQVEKYIVNFRLFFIVLIILSLAIIGAIGYYLAKSITFPIMNVSRDLNSVTTEIQAAVEQQVTSTRGQAISAQ